jgi:peptidoglycan/LPS O-acetylase OafA/YrhL
MVFGVLNRDFSGVVFAASLVRNYFPLHGSVNGWYTGHFWSLSVEEHFYLLFPSLLVIFRKYRVSILVVLICVLKVWQLLVDKHRFLQFGWAPAYRTDIAVTGILLAASVALLLIRPRVRAWCQFWLHPYAALAVASIVWIMVNLKIPHYSYYYFVDFALLCTYPLLIVSTLLHPKNLIGRAFELAPVRFIGRISYSVYLWQMLFFTHAYASPPAPHSPVLFYIQMSWLRYPATLVASVVSYYVIEKPMVRLGHRLTKSVVPTREATAAAEASHENVSDSLITAL